MEQVLGVKIVGTVHWQTKSALMQTFCMESFYGRSTEMKYSKSHLEHLPRSDSPITLKCADGM